MKIFEHIASPPTPPPSYDQSQYGNSIPTRKMPFVNKTPKTTPAPEAPDENDYDVEIGDRICGIHATSHKLRVRWGIILVPFAIWFLYVLVQRFVAKPW